MEESPIQKNQHALWANTSKREATARFLYISVTTHHQNLSELGTHKDSVRIETTRSKPVLAASVFHLSLWHLRFKALASHKVAQGW